MMQIDTQLFNEYWEKISQELHVYLIRKTNQTDAEDILQDIAQLSFKKFGMFQGHDKEYLDFVKWVYGVSNNKVKKWRSKYRSLSYRDITNCKASGNLDNMVDILIAAERTNLLLSLLQSLPEKDKQLILFRNYQELPYEQISKITGKTTSALMTQHTRIIKKLYRKILKYEEA